MTDIIGIASDHGGYILKAHVVQFLRELDYKVQDFGTNDERSVDYPDFAIKVARPVSEGNLKRGILICGTGIGMSIAANRFQGVRATLVWDEFTARAAREHNNSNILVLGERVLNHDRALDLVKIWLDTPGAINERHKARLKKIDEVLAPSS